MQSNRFQEFLQSFSFSSEGGDLPALDLVGLCVCSVAHCLCFGFGVVGLRVSRSAWKNCSVGALSSGVVWKLSSVSVVRGSGVGVILHSRSRFVVGGWGMLGSPTILLDKGFLSESLLSESLLSGSVNHPLRLAVVVLGVLRPEMEQGFVSS